MRQYLNAHTKLGAAFEVMVTAEAIFYITRGRVYAPNLHVKDSFDYTGDVL
jgi:hypothetical protein